MVSDRQSQAAVLCRYVVCNLAQEAENNDEGTGWYVREDENTGCWYSRPEQVHLTQT